MRNIITFVTTCGLIATACLGLATITKGSQEEFWISGKVETIENGMINVRDPNGDIFNVAAKSDKLEGIEVGDRVVVHDAGGWVVSIKKIGKTEMKQEAKQIAVTATEETIIGEVTLVGESTLKVKEDNTQTEYVLAASADKLRDINTGYRIEVKATAGKVLSLITLGLPAQAESEFYQKWKVIEEPQG
jgi:hypothetical protein